MNWSKKVEVAANVATIVFAIVASFVLFRGSGPIQQKASAPVAHPATQVGTNLQSSRLQVDWSANQRTLILGMQTGCHYCTDSAPFFRKLSEAAMGRVKTVAVLPQRVEDSQVYLDKLGIHVDKVVQAQLSVIGVTGTPTLFLVDQKGIVKDVWVGKLPPERESEVLSAIQGKTVTEGQRASHKTAKIG